MPFHLAAWSQSQTSNSVMQAYNAVTDQSIFTSGLDMIAPRGFNNIAGAWAFGATIIRAQLQSPSLRAMFQQEINPQQAVNNLAGPPSWANFIESPLKLADGEKVEAWMANSTNATEQDSMFAWFSDGPITPVTGDIHSVKVTGATTAVGYAWTIVPLTFDQTLPVGRYQLVGGRMRGASLLAWRAVPFGGTFRPGSMGFYTDLTPGERLMRYGRMGVWCEFDYLQPPQIEIFCTTTDTSQVGIFDLIKIS